MPCPGYVAESPCTAQTPPAGISSAVSNFAPEYSRMALTFSVTASSPFLGKYVSGARTFRLPPVIFMQVRRLPCASRMIL